MLQNNAVYRLGDLATHKGQRWRLDSVSVLCQPIFRGTILREFLKATSRWRGQLLPIADAEAESLAAAIDDGRLGYACLRGNSTEMPSSMSFLNVTGWHRRLLLADLVEKRFRKGGLETAAADELVVYLRMGDVVPDFGNVTRAVDAALEEHRGIHRLVLSGVLHFGGIGEYVYSEIKIQPNLEVLRRLTQRYEVKGFEVSVRSDPDADADLCYLAFAPHVVLDVPTRLNGTPGGYATMVSGIRKALKASRRQGRRGSLPPILRRALL